jgi:hypothetical protein
MERTGRCLCGAVRLRAEDVASDLHACHCGHCRAWAGGPLFAVGVGALHLDDDAAVGVHASSDWAERGFCTRCGSGLFFRVTATGETLVPVGVFDDESGFELASEIFVDASPGSYALAGDHARLTGAEFLALHGAGADD